MMGKKTVNFVILEHVIQAFLFCCAVSQPPFCKPVVKFSSWGGEMEFACSFFLRSNDKSRHDYTGVHSGESLGLSGFLSEQWWGSLNSPHTGMRASSVTPACGDGVPSLVFA